MCRKVQGSQIFKQNWIISIRSRVIVILLIWAPSALAGGAGGWGVSGVISYSLYEFRNVRGKESSNRIELSWLVQDLLNFAVLGSLRLWGWGGWVDVGVGWLGGAPTHVHMHAHARMHTHARACVVNMIIPCKWPPPLDLGKSRGFPMMSYVCVHVCMHVHVHMGGVHLLTTPHSHPPIPLPPSGGDPQNQSKFNSTWTNWDISILFEDLKSVEIFPPMGGCIISWVGFWWVGSGQITKNLKIVDWIKIIQFCLKIYDL